MNSLLDTNLLIDINRKYAPAAEFLNSLSEWVISIMTHFELIRGTKNKEQLNKIEKDLKQFETLYVDKNIQHRALEIYSKFKLSHNVSIVDSFIAATAIEYNMVLVTRNLKHYKFIKGLELYKPY